MNKLIEIPFKGTSMTPLLKNGDLLYVALEKNYKLADIVVMKTDNDFIAHRIVKIGRMGIYTKGDRSFYFDDLKEKHIIGTVIAIKRENVFYHIKSIHLWAILSQMRLGRLLLSKIALLAMFILAKFSLNKINNPQEIIFKGQ